MSGPVLLVGIEDAELLAVSRALEEMGCPHDVLGTRAPVELSVHGGRALWRLGDREIDLAAGPAYTAVYTRFLGLAPTHPAGSPRWDREAFLRARFYDAEILALKVALLQDLQASGARMYNGISIPELEIKAHRLIAFARAGLPVPDSLFTESAESLRAFAGRHARVIYKPVTGGARVRALEPADLSDARAAALGRAPVTFQEMIGGADVRVYVCDAEILAAVQSHTEHEVDARGRETGFEPVDLPPTVLRTCLEACALCSLRFSAVDLRVGAGGEHRLLECNNHPMFDNIDRATGGHIARGLARRLAAPGG